MANHIDWYLVELERRLSSLGDDRRSVILLEVENHLREQADELVLLGLDGEEADREAVRAFGEPRQFAEKLMDQGDGTKRMGQKGTALATAAGVASIVVFVAVWGLTMPLLMGYFREWVMFCASIAVFGALRSRRMTFVSASVTFGLGVIAATALLAVFSPPIDMAHPSPFSLGQRILEQFRSGVALALAMVMVQGVARGILAIGRRRRRSSARRLPS